MAFFPFNRHHIGHIYPRFSRIINAYYLLKSPVRGYLSPDPGTLEQRLFRAVTKVVIPPVKITPTERRIKRAEDRRLLELHHPYRLFLVQKAREDFFQAAEGRMILVLQPLYHTRRDIISVRNQLHIHQMAFRGFPVPILREAAEGTPWEIFVRHFLRTDSQNLYIFGAATPEQCQHALRILRKAPFLLLLGGLVEHRIMTVDDLLRYGSSTVCRTLEDARSQLLGTLENSAQQLPMVLNANQNDLVCTLKQLLCQS